MPTIGFHTLGKSFVANNPPMSLFFVIKICYNTLQIYYYFLFVSKNICTMGRQYIVTKLKCIFSLQTCSNKLTFSNNLDILNQTIIAFWNQWKTLVLYTSCEIPQLWVTGCMIDKYWNLLPNLVPYNLPYQWLHPFEQPFFLN